MYKLIIILITNFLFNSLNFVYYQHFENLSHMLNYYYFDLRMNYCLYRYNTQLIYEEIYIIRMITYILLLLYRVISFFLHLISYFVLMEAKKYFDFELIVILFLSIIFLFGNAFQKYLLLNFVILFSF